MKSRSVILSILVGVLLTSAPARAQTRPSPVDSLQTLLETALEDTNKARIYGLLSWHYARSHDYTGIARQYADSSMALAQKLKNEARVAMAHYYMGIIDRYEGNYEEALRHLDEHITYFNQKGDSSRVADGLYNLAVVHKLLGNYEKSLSAFFRILDISQAEHNEQSIATISHSIGLIYRQLKKYDEAGEYYHRALHSYEKSDKQKSVAMSLNSLGSLYAAKGEYEIARPYFEKAIKINQKLGHTREMAFQIANLGHIANKLDNYEEGLTYHLQALKIREQLPQKLETVSSLRNAGHTYTLLGNYSQARSHLTQALALAAEVQAKPHLRDIYQMLAELHELEGNSQQALAFQKLYVAVKDSILDEETAKQINELQARYETAKKNEEIATLSKENELREAEADRRAIWNKILIGGLILFAIMGGLVVFVLRQRHKNQQLVAAKNEEVKTARYKQQLSELEMKALRAQMNPHFIFNCMNSINRMILSEDSNNASRYLTKFSKLIRLMLENSEKITVPLRDELAMLEAYIQLEALRFKGKINYRISVDEEIDKDHTLVPSMVLQPFVENAIWHGLMHKEGDGLLNVTISEAGDILRCVIEDNGVGREKALELQENAVMKHRSLGLQITEERLLLFSKKEMQKLINITDLKDSVDRALGTRVDISIPIA